MTSKLAAAMALASQGHRVFPLAINGKTPAFDGNWRKLATSDPAKVESFWTCPVLQTELDYNIGIAVPPDELYVDIDKRDGKQGFESLKLLEAIYEPLPDTYTVDTPSGGEHRRFKIDPDKSFAKILATDIDLKGDGGYVVAPGSTIDGVPYRARDQVQRAPAALPEWVHQHAPAGRRNPAQRMDDATGMALADADTDSAVARAIAYLEKTAPDHGTYAVAAKVKDFGISREKCLDLMMEHWEPAASKGEEHISFRVDNAYRYGTSAIGVNSPEAEFDAVALPANKTILRGGIELQPITEFDALDIPKRQWVLGTFAAKNYLSGLVSPPGVGKTTFLLMVAVAIATGRDDITGLQVHQRGKVLLWNQEDETDELKRRLLAVMAAFNVAWSDILDDTGKPRIILGSGVDRRLMFAKRDASGYVKPAPDAKAIEDYIREEGIDLAIFDPFVEMHEANENDNPEVAVVGAVFRRVAVKANCAVLLAHHTRKPPAASASDAYAGNMDTARGAGSLGGVARMVATLYAIDKETGKRYGIGEDECRRYIRFDDAKANMSLVSGEPRFFRRDGVTIGGFGGEEIGVLRPVELERGKDAKTAARDDLVADALEVLGEEEFRPLVDVAKDLAALPLHADKTERALVAALKRAFAQNVTNEQNEQIGIATRGVPGRKGDYACLTRTPAQPESAQRVRKRKTQ